MQTLSISKFCQTGSGGTPSRSRLGDYYEFGKIPWIKSGELAQDAVTSADEFITEEGLKNSSAKLLEPGAILVAMYGATVGQVSQLKILAATNQAICHIYPDKSICYPEYLYWVLKGSKEKLLAKRVGGGQPNISQKILRSFPIPLPPLAEQKRIAGILDAADALRVKRRDAIASLNTLLQSTFLTLFGDPVTNPMGWEVRKSSDLFLVPPRIGTATPAKGKGYLVVRVGEIGQSRIDFEKCGRVEISQTDFEKFQLHPGDTVIARAIGSKNQLGKASFFTDFHEKVVADSHVMRLRPDPTQCDSYWFYSLISSNRGKMLIQKAGGATAVQFNINGKQASSLNIPLPPLKLQNQFTTIAKSIDKQKSQQLAHLAELDTLFASLQSRAFNGEL